MVQVFAREIKWRKQSCMCLRVCLFNRIGVSTGLLRARPSRVQMQALCANYHACRSCMA